MSDHSSSDHSSDKVAVRLEGPTNYIVWSRVILGPLMARNVTGHISGDSKKPTSSATADNQSAIDDWVKMDNKAKGIVHTNISTSMVTMLGDNVLTMTAKEVWDKLKEHCKRKDMWTVVDLVRQLVTTRLPTQADTGVGEQHINIMANTCNQFENIGKPLPDWMKGAMLISSVPTDDMQWQMWVTAHTATETEPSWDKAAAAIRAELHKQSVQQTERARKLAEASPEHALAAKTSNRTGHHRGGRPFCTHCKKAGHVMDTCYELHPELRKDRSHYSNFVTVGDHPSDNVGSALVCRDSVSTTGPWFVDSGASKHLTGDKRWFTKLHECVPCTVTTADRGVLSCSQRGTVVLNTQHGAFAVHDVLYVPALAVNLLSVSALLKSRYRVHFTKAGCVIRTSRNKLVAQAAAHDNVYLVRATPQPPSAQALSATTSSGLDWATAHARLGHLNPRSIQLLHDKQMAHGVALPTAGSPADVSQCAGCIVGKAHRLPFPEHATYRATRPLQLVHSDMCGPITGSDEKGKLYLLTFIDDYSRWVWLTITTDKSGASVLKQFVRFKVWAEKYTGFEVKTLRTDNGGEYINDDFKTYLHTMGIERQTTVAYSPSQNGVAERMNRSIMEAARSMLHASGLPHSQFWSYAVHAAVYLRNRSPTRALDNITPHEAWRGEKPTLSHLRVFGCKAYMHINKEKRSGKLTDRAVPTVFVGYSTEAKAWLAVRPGGQAQASAHVPRRHFHGECSRQHTLSLPQPQRRQASLAAAVAYPQRPPSQRTLTGRPSSTCGSSQTRSLTATARQRPQSPPDRAWPQSQPASS